jgi:predicted secreted protein
MRSLAVLCFVFLVFCAFPAATPVEGSSGALLEGIVRTIDGNAAPEVDISVWDGRTNRGAVTDGEGKFTVSGIPAGTVFAVRFTPKRYPSVRVDGFRFPESGNLYLSIEYGAADKGQRYTTRVPSNPSTGYEWFLFQLGNSSVAAFRENSMETDKVETAPDSEWNTPKDPPAGGEWSSPGRQPSREVSGRGGWESWSFNTFGAGSTAIVLGYCRPWETAISPSRYHVFSLSVR